MHCLPSVGEVRERRVRERSNSVRMRAKHAISLQAVIRALWSISRKLGHSHLPLHCHPSCNAHLSLNHTLNHNHVLRPPYRNHHSLVPSLPLRPPIKLSLPHTLSLPVRCFPHIPAR